MSALTSAAAIPRLPSLGWHAVLSERSLSQPSVLDHPRRLLTTSGRAAIALALRCLQIGPGDRVLVPTYHCPTMIAPITACGAEPVFFPITADGDADIQWLQATDLAGVRAIIAAHYFGLPLHFASLRAFCDSRGIALIEDCAHALFGRCEGVSIGSWGDLAIASLTKFLPVQECGLLVANRTELPQLRGTARGPGNELRALLDMLEIGSQHGGFPPFGPLLSSMFRLKRRLRRTQLTTATDTQDAPPQDIQWLDADLIDTPPTRVNTLAIRATLRDSVIQRRRANFERLLQLLDDLPGAYPLVRNLPPDCAPYVFPLHSERPDERYRYLRASGLPLFRWDWLWPDTPDLPDDAGVRWARQVFQLPCHQDLSERDLQCIADTVRAACHEFPAG